MAARMMRWVKNSDIISAISGAVTWISRKQEPNVTYFRIFSAGWVGFITIPSHPVSSNSSITLFTAGMSETETFPNLLAVGIQYVSKSLYRSSTGILWGLFNVIKSNAKNLTSSFTYGGCSIL